MSNEDMGAFWLLVIALVFLIAPFFAFGAR